MFTINKKQLTTLLELPGISGSENKIYDFLKKEIKKNNLELHTDNLGSIWGIKKSKNPKAKSIIIDAHMDEVGFVVTDISKEGFISFEAHGGISTITLNSQRLSVWNKDLTKSYSGVVIFPKNHNNPSSIVTPPKIEDLLLDVGASSKKELIKWGINLGSTITFNTNVEFNGNRVISKAADNRVGVSMVVDLMKFISQNNFDFDIIIGSSTQEEVGIRGARTSVYKFKPDLAMIIDVSPANDFPSPKPSEGILGKGTMLRHKDALTIYSDKVINYLRKIIKENKINYQDYFSKGGTNAGVMHLWTEGRAVIPFGIVSRLIHSGSSIFDLQDYIDTIEFIKIILTDLNSKKIVKLNY